MISFAIFVFSLVVILAVRRITLIGVQFMSTLADLQAAISANTDAVNALTAAAGTITPPHDFQPEVDAIAANTAAVNAVTAQLGSGTP